MSRRASQGRRVLTGASVRTRWFSSLPLLKTTKARRDFRRACCRFGLCSYVYGGGGTRTPKGLRPPHFECGALPVRLRLPSHFVPSLRLRVSAETWPVHASTGPNPACAKRGEVPRFRMPPPEERSRGNATARTDAPASHLQPHLPFATSSRRRNTARFSSATSPAISIGAPGFAPVAFGDPRDLRFLALGLRRCGSNRPVLILSLLCHSNRGARICSGRLRRSSRSPLPRPRAQALRFEPPGSHPLTSLPFQSGRPDSNRGPLRPERSALPD